MSIITFVVVVQLSVIFVGFFAYILCRLFDRFLLLWLLECLKSFKRSLPINLVRCLLSSQSWLLQHKPLYYLGVKQPPNR